MAAALFRFVGDATSLKKAAAESAAAMKGVEATAASSSAGIGTKMAAAGKAIAAIGAVGVTAMAAAGFALYKVGETFKESYDTIRIGTGATGAALDGLKNDFKQVVKDVPTDFASASTAIADINTRLGLTGKPLQDLSKQFLDLSRITKTDVADNVDKMTRVFGDWQVSTDKQADTLDKLYRASQASGIGLDDLSGSLVQFGAPLRNLGFSLDESTALLATWNKAGVNTDTVIAGLKKGVGTLAKAGEDVPTTFKRIVNEIRALGPGTEATQKAIELFGTRAGPDLADAIAGGKFEIDQLMDAVVNGSDTINQGAKDTENFGEKWQRFKNNILVAIEPLATKVFNGVGKAMDKLAPIFAEIIGGVTTFIATVQDGGDDITSSGIAGAFQMIGVKARNAWDTVWSASKKVWPVIKQVGKALWDIKPILAAIAVGFAVYKTITVLTRAWAVAQGILNAALNMNPISAIIIAIAAVAAAVYLAYQRFDWFHKVVDKVWQGIQTAAKWAWENVLKPVFTAIAWYVQNILIPQINILWHVFQGVWNVITTIAVWAWQNVLQPVFNAIGWVIQNVVIPYFKLWWAVVSTVFNAIVAVAQWVWTNVLSPIFNAIGWVISNVVVPYFQLFWEVAKVVWNAVYDAVTWAWGKIQPVFAAIATGISWVKDIVGDAVGGIVNFIAGLASRVASAGAGIWNWLTDGFNAAWNGLKWLWDQIVSWVGGFAGTVAGVARGMWDGISNAFKSALNWVIDRWNGLEFTIPGFSAFGVNIGGFTLGVPDIPRLAAGLVASQPMLAVIGERNTEVVFPTDNPERGFNLLRAAGVDTGRGQNAPAIGKVENHIYGGDARTVARETTDEILWRLKGRR